MSNNPEMENIMIEQDLNIIVEDKVETTDTETVSDKLTPTEVTALCERIRNAPSCADGARMLPSAVEITPSQLKRVSLACESLDKRIAKEDAIKAENKVKIEAWKGRKEEVTQFHVKYGTPQEYSEWFLDRITPEQVLKMKNI